MVKNVLTGAFVALTILSAGAQTKVYQSEELGDVYGISNNGEYAVVSDDENNRAYLWTRTSGEFTEISAPMGDSSKPSSERVKGTCAFGVNDSGTIVGSLFYADGTQRPAICKDGVWADLPLSEFALYTNSAISITNDEKYIVGYQFYSDPASEIGGRYRPCRWTLGADGVYTLKSYEDIILPDHQGFYPLCASPDGNLAGGKVYGGVDSEMACYINFETGEFFLDHKISEKKEPWIYRGKYYCGTDESGKQIWSEDPDDPRIVLFLETYIDGIKSDGNDESRFSGFFSGVDNEGCFYGRRSVASDVDAETGTGTITSGAAIYNTKTGEWTDNTAVQGYYGGLDKGAYIFGAGDQLFVGGKASTFTSEFDFTYQNTLNALTRSSLSGQVIGGSTLVYNPATGEPQFFPIIIVLDHDLIEGVGVQQIGGGNSSITVRTAAGFIEVAGARTVAVYDLQGRLVSRSAASAVAPGMYVVVADGKVTKAVVK